LDVTNIENSDTLICLYKFRTIKDLNSYDLVQKTANFEKLIKKASESTHINLES